MSRPGKRVQTQEAWKYKRDNSELNEYDKTKGEANI
jgi:hypothetical protein